MTGVEVRGVTKVYGRGATAYPALRGVDLSAAPGEVVMISGPSGSGKTTLLSIIGCALTATSGQVRLFDQVVSGRAESELPALRLAYVGFVFQGTNLLASLPIIENVALPLELRGRSTREARHEATALLERVGLGIGFPVNRQISLAGNASESASLARSPAVRRSSSPTSQRPPSTRRTGFQSRKCSAPSRRSMATR